MTIWSYSFEDGKIAIKLSFWRWYFSATKCQTDEAKASFPIIFS